MTRIPEDVLPVLAECRFAGAVAFLPEGRLDRKLYLATNKVLEALGGHWDRKAKGHVFAEGDAAARVDEALMTGTYERAENFDFFPTPKPLAGTVARMAKVQPGMRVLEPSAGDGALCDMLTIGLSGGMSWCWMRDLTCVELRDDLRVKLLEKGYSVSGTPDFLANRTYEVVAGFRPFDRVVMNPPFSRQQDVDHVAEALNYLAPDGLLVAIMSAGIEFRTTKKTVALRELIAARGGTITRNPDGSFKPSGTNVNTVTVVIPGRAS